MDYPHMMNDEAIDPAMPVHNTARAAYALFALGLFFPVCTLAGLIVAYIKRKDAAGSDYASHFTWLIRTFWLAVAGAVIGALTMLIGVGVLLLLALWIWYIYRIVSGYLKFHDRQPVEQPARLL